MKTELYDINGEKKSGIELPKVFNSKIRDDIVLKYFEVSKEKIPHAPYKEAGKRHSAAGTISHKRHDWKGHYGSGRSRMPRKTMWRRGVHFYWIGAEVSGARGGRRAHPPKIKRKEKKINLKEARIAMDSGFAATANKDYLLKRYSSIEKLDLKLPIIVESNLEKIKTKNALKLLKEIFGDLFNLAIKRKEVRSGKGKSRGRRYKSNAGVLLVKRNDEKIKMKGIDIKNIREVEIGDLYPLGRLTVYTEKAIGELLGREK